MNTVIDAATAEVARTRAAMDAAESAHHQSLNDVDTARALRDRRGIERAERAERAAHRAMWDARRAHWSARDAEYMAQRAQAGEAREAAHRQDAPFHGATDAGEESRG